MCGMYQHAKDLSKELDADIFTLKFSNPIYRLYPLFDFFKFWRVLSKNNYKEVITFIYPMHLFGEMAKGAEIKWKIFDQLTPPATKFFFPNFLRRQYMKIFNWLDERSKSKHKGWDSYTSVLVEKQKPRYKTKCKDDIFCECHLSHKPNVNPNVCCEVCRTKIPLSKEIIIKYFKKGIDLTKQYSINTGRTTDYKNFNKLKDLMSELKIPLVHPENEPDKVIHALLSNAKMFVSMSLWEGFGRGVMEMEALDESAIAYDVGTHKKHIKKGICVPLGDEKAFKEAIIKVWNR